MDEKCLRILFVEDVLSDAEFAQRALKKEGLAFDSMVVDTQEAFVAALEEFYPDIIISDYAMPTFDGTHALILSLARDATLPFIVLTASRNEETAVACIKAGATDYVLKDRIARLPFAVREALEQRQTRLEKQAAEKALRESEEKFRALVENSPVVVARFDRQFRYLYVNREIEKTVARKAYDFIGKTHRELGFSAEQSVYWEHAIQEVFDSGKPASRELEFEGSSGVVVFSWQLVPELDDRGQVQTVLGIFRDITERKRMEEELKVQRDFATQVMNTMGQGLSVTNGEGRLEFVNLAYAQMVGCTPEEMIGKSLADFAYSEDQPILAQARAQRREGKTTTYEMRLKRTTAGLVHALITGVPLWHDGKFAGAVTVITDLTESKWAEAIAAARTRILQFSPSHTLPEILQNVLNECQTLTASSFGLCRFIQADASALSLQNWPSQMFNVFSTVEGKGTHHLLSQAGVWADCIRERRAIISNDDAAMANRNGMPPGDAVVNRFLSVPILRGGDIVAIISVGNKPTDYDDRDVEVVTQLADLSWDITERKRAEEALHTSELRYRSLFENVAVPTWEEDFSKVKDYVDSLGTQDIRAYFDTHPDQLAYCASLVKIISVNQEGLRVFRANHGDDILRHQVSDYFVDGSWQVFKDELIALLDGKMRFESELPFLDSTGKIRQSLLRLSVVPGFENALGRVLLSFIDITERREMEQALSALSRRLFEAQEAERRNVARELHDEIGQVLTAVKSNLQTSKLLTDPEMSASFLDESIGIVDQALQQVRDLSLNLRPSLLDDFGLVPALEWYLNRQAHRSNFIAKFVAVPHATEVPQTLATTCFRVAQAALTNVERHAQAKHVWVELHLRHVRTTPQEKRSELELVIRDDGMGFDSKGVLEAAQRGATLGLVGMQERVWLAGGHIEIHSQPMRGTEIIARFPVLQPHVERRSKRRTV